MLKKDWSEALMLSSFVLEYPFLKTTFISTSIFHSAGQRLPRLHRLPGHVAGYGGGAATGAGQVHRSLQL